jgi:hypothetical protein
MRLQFQKNIFYLSLQYVIWLRQVRRCESCNIIWVLKKYSKWVVL